MVTTGGGNGDMNCVLVVVCAGDAGEAVVERDTESGGGAGATNPVLSVIDSVLLPVTREYLYKNKT